MRDRAPCRHRAPSPDLRAASTRWVERELTPHGTLDGGGARLRGRGCAESSERGGALGDRLRGEGTDRRKRSGVGAGSSVRGVKVHCRPKLPERSVVRRFGIPVTHPVQTLIDLATELKPMRLERAVNQADVHDLVDPETLRTALDGFAGDAWGQDAADDARPAYVPALRLRPRDSLSATCSRSGFPLSPLETLGARVRSRLLLPRPRPDRRDRRAADTTARLRSRPAWSNGIRSTPPPGSGCSASRTGRSPTRPPKSRRSSAHPSHRT